MKNDSQSTFSLGTSRRECTRMRNRRRSAEGAERRRQVPLSAHSEWKVSPDRTDPVEVLMGQGKTRDPGTASDQVRAGESYSPPGANRNRKFVDSLLEGNGFELPVRERCKRGLRRKSPASAACRRRSSAAAVGSHKLRLQAKSRNRTLIAHETGTSNPPPSGGESNELQPATVTFQEDAEVPTANPRNLPCGVAQECALRVAGLVRVHVPLPAQWD